MEGLRNTCFSSIVEASAIKSGVSDEGSDSIVSPGPFGTVPLIDREFSSDSSYQLSRKRDVQHSYDTLTHTSSGEITPEGYRAEMRRRQIDQIDQLIQRMGSISGLSVTASSSSLTVDHTAQFSSSLGEITPYHPPDSLRVIDWQGGTTTDPSQMDEDSSLDSSDLLIYSSQDTDSFQQKLRFPLHRIADPRQNTRVTISPQLLNRASALGADPMNETSDSSLGPSFIPLAKPYNQIYIEEIVGDTLPGSIVNPPTPNIYLQLAQGTPLSSQDTETVENEDNILEFREWIAGLQGFTTPSSLDSSIASSAPSKDITTSTATTQQVLEILPTPGSTSSSQEDSSSSVSYIMRGMLLSPPQENEEHSTSDSEMVPSLVPGHEDETISDSSSVEELIMSDSRDAENGQPVYVAGAEPELAQLIQGMAQGLAISPVVHVTMEAYLAELDEAARAYHESGDQQYLANYEGEFYEDDNAYEQSTNGETQADPLDLLIQSSPEASVASPSESYAGSEYYNQDHSGGYYGDANEGGMPSDTSDRWGGIEFEGNTVASMASYLSEVEVQMVGQSIPQVDGYLVEIPVRELVDPPDWEVEEAASLGDREIECRNQIT